MTTIQINTSRKYNVLVGNGLMNEIGALLVDALGKKCKLAIVSDSNVWPLYGDKVTNALSLAGFQVCSFVFPAGEASKNATTYLEILNFLAENQITRTDAVVALGGGVVGDVTGFAAATYLRGIRYIQVPTTLLAMVDSSVGGKTAIDLPIGKNLVGAFCQPSVVVCDLDALSTLPLPVFCDGCAEVIKYGILYDEELFSHLEAKGTEFDAEAVLSRCIALKGHVVEKDEFDAGDRQKLNLGHTFGHAIEALSDFTLTHGQAVAIGTCIIAKACCGHIYPRVEAVFKKFHLPTATTFSAAEIFSSALSDKKRAGSTINLIVPKKIGDCAIQATPVDSVESLIKEGL